MSVAACCALVVGAAYGIHTLHPDKTVSEEEDMTTADVADDGAQIAKSDAGVRLRGGTFRCGGIYRQRDRRAAIYRERKPSILPMMTHWLRFAIPGMIRKCISENHRGRMKITVAYTTHTVKTTTITVGDTEDYLQG